MIAGVEDEVTEIKSLETEEKNLRRAEMEANKIKNMMIHEEDIQARPRRTWFQTKQEKEAASLIGKPKTEAELAKEKEEADNLNKYGRKKMNARDRATYSKFGVIGGGQGEKKRPHRLSRQKRRRLEAEMQGKWRVGVWLVVVCVGWSLLVGFFEWWCFSKKNTHIGFFFFLCLLWCMFCFQCVQWDVSADRDDRRERREARMKGEDHTSVSGKDRNVMDASKQASSVRQQKKAKREGGQMSYEKINEKRKESKKKGKDDNDKEDLFVSFLTFIFVLLFVFVPAKIKEKQEKRASKKGGGQETGAGSAFGSEMAYATTGKFKRDVFAKEAQTKQVGVGRKSKEKKNKASFKFEDRSKTAGNKRHGGKITGFKSAKKFKRR